MKLEMNKFKRCTKCVMDNLSDDYITFDENGVCNYYLDAVAQMESGSYLPNDKGKKKLDDMISRIKKGGKGKKYDCLMGISGGLDSAYLAYLGGAVWGLRILAVHVDDGFDTELAKRNIDNLCKASHIELKTITPDAEQFNDLTRAFILADLPEVATPQDNILFACLYQCAKEYGIKYFLSGGNFALESILQQGSSSHTVYDMVHNRNIHKLFGTKPINKLPFLSNWQRIWNAHIYGLKTFRPLNYIDYNRNKAIQELNSFCGFTYYGSKHLENALTKVIQLYWYYHKFNIDKRKSHLSSMIVSGQMTRDEALNELERPIYDKDEMEKDLNFVLSKLGLTREVFDSIVARPGKKPTDYRTDRLFSLMNYIASKLLKDKKVLIR